MRPYGDLQSWWHACRDYERRYLMTPEERADARQQEELEQEERERYAEEERENERDEDRS